LVFAGKRAAIGENRLPMRLCRKFARSGVGQPQLHKAQSLRTHALPKGANLFTRRLGTMSILSSGLAPWRLGA